MNTTETFPLTCHYCKTVLEHLTEAELEDDDLVGNILDAHDEHCPFHP